LISSNVEARAVKDVKEIGQDLYKGKVESKLHQETAAMENKKREKFVSGKDSGKDAITMGGRLPTMGSGTNAPVIRSVPSWR
jgi:hypothetical protein